jgi:peptidoglycan LD-endopeptidase CwlK
VRDRKLDDLAPGFRGLVFIFLARCVEAGIALFVVETLRTEEQHQADLASGHSWIKRSKHQDGLAIDVAPYETYIEHGDKKANWDASDPSWQQMGEIGEALGLVWGGRWKQKDSGHFELAAKPAA